MRRSIEGAAGDDDRGAVVEPDRSVGAEYRVLIVDGDCALCRASVRWLLARDSARRLRVASRDSAFARGVFARHPTVAAVDSVLWVEADPQLGEFVLTRWRATNRAARHVGGWPSVLGRGLDRLLPIRLLDAGYAVVATLRRRLWSDPSCRLPDAVHAERLLS
jgi:predicted DCC family thiol-disulfide oxidoreductase YuxK